MKIKKEMYENKPKDIKNNVSQFLIFKKVIYITLFKEIIEKVNIK